MNKYLPVLPALLLLAALPGWGQQKFALSVTASPTFSHIYYNYRYFYPESDGQIVEPVYLNGQSLVIGL